ASADGTPPPFGSHLTCGGQLVQPGHLIASGGTLSDFAGAIPRFAPEVNRLVVNRTHLLGMFDVELSWTPGASANGPSTAVEAPSFFTALQEQLGLKLEATRELMDVLVIDHVEHPTED